VALTRAQDRLYVGGWTSGKYLSDDCWYRIIEDALKNKSGTHNHLQGDHEQIASFSEDKSHQESSSLPAWVYKQPVETGGEKNNPSEKKVPSNAAMERGTLIHRFFEYLPLLPESHRYEAACQMVEKEKLTPSEWEKDINATLQILEDPAFKEIFGSSALAEVPVSGLINGVPFQGRIDRLIVTSDQITIVDYKTDRNPSVDAAIPPAYAKQLESYAMALRTIYPGHKIRKIILWVTGPAIQLIE
jgi:ATP-dependent helicase/nuclease subunit A